MRAQLMCIISCNLPLDSNIECLSIEELRQLVKELRPLALAAMSGKSSKKLTKNTLRHSPTHLYTSHSGKRRSSFMTSTDSSTIMSVSDVSSSPINSRGSHMKGYSSSISDKSSDSSSSDITKGNKKLLKKLF